MKNTGSVGLSCKLTEDVQQNTTVLEVLNFNISVESAFSDELLATFNLDDDVLIDLKISFLEINRVPLFSGESERISVFTILEFKRKNTHTNEI